MSGLSDETIVVLRRVLLGFVPSSIGVPPAPIMEEVRAAGAARFLFLVPRVLRRTLLLAAVLIVLALLALNDPHGTAALLRSLMP